MAKRKRGGQPGNRNAWKHGQNGRVTRPERRAAADARLQRDREWQAKMPVTDYAAICAVIEASGATKH